MRTKLTKVHTVKSRLIVQLVTLQWPAISCVSSPVKTHTFPHNMKCNKCVKFRKKKRNEFSFRQELVAEIHSQQLSQQMQTSYRPGGLYIVLSRGPSLNQLGHHTLCLPQLMHLSYSLKQLGHHTLCWSFV